MPGMEDFARTLPAIETIINYVDPDAPIGGINDVEREKSTFSLLPYQVAVRDMRPLAKSLSLDTTGFVLVERPSRVTDFYDQKQVEDIYLPEIQALIRDLTGAERVLTFGTIVRNNAPDAPAITHKSVHNAHIDYNIQTTRVVVDRLLPEAEKPRYAGGRVMQMNVWRPIVTVESAPLALCDSSTVARADLIHGPIGGKSVAGPGAAGYNLAYNPNHRWYYAPRLRPSEALVFRLCDSEPASPQWAAHTSFADPTSGPDAAPRQSIEVRTLALFPN
ncbi:MAG TPA: CmcJ/NvfI family oxidoreductase [Stellaceae bacterium]|nr:CmcJ/NvfI family oxidoreductase [Stellaceae bacterium]